MAECSEYPDLQPPMADDLHRLEFTSVELFNAIADTRTAVIALIFWLDDNQLNLCLGRRSQVKGDPWSGDLAFPGGKREPNDSSLHATAARETFEEIGLVLPSDSLLGGLGQMHAHGGYQPLVTYPLIYLLKDAPGPFLLNDELIDAQWIQLKKFWDASRWVRFYYPAKEGLDCPAVHIMDYLFWGFSLRVLHEFSLKVQRPLTRLLEDSSLPRLKHDFLFRR